MKFTDIQVDGFGAQRDLRLRDLSPGVTAIYGANEAGKTTLLEFVRAILYGANEDRRKRYLSSPQQLGWGGAIDVEVPNGKFSVSRKFDAHQNTLGRLSVQDSTGKEREASTLSVLLSQVDEATYNNVYAVGLQELQELGSLSDTDAAQWLYGLTTGLDRVSLLDVMRNLEASRNRLLSAEGRESTIAQLVRKRESLLQEIREQGQSGRQWTQLSTQLAELKTRCHELDVTRAQHDDQARFLETAIQIEPIWKRRIDLQEKTEQFAGRLRMPEDILERLDGWKERIAKHHQQRDLLRGQRQALAEEVDKLGINRTLVRSASRVEALGEQKDWLEALERQAAAIRHELSEIQSQLKSENERLGLELRSSPDKQTPEISESLLNNLRPHGKALRVAREKVATAEREANARREAEFELQAQIEAAMPEAVAAHLPTDLGEAGELVASLQRRMHLEQRIEQAERQQTDLEQQNHELLDRQDPPLWIEGAQTMLWIVGGALLAFGLLLSAAPAAWTGGIIVAVLAGLALFRYVQQEQIADRRDAVERQLDLLRKQIDEGQAERLQWEEDAPPISGSLVVQLQAAERHLAELEKLYPIESKRREATGEAERAERRVEEAKRKLDACRQNWRAKLSAAGLPRDWTPNDLRKMAGTYEQVSELRMRVARRREDAEQRQREHQTLCERIRNLAEEVNLLRDEDNPMQQLEHLLSQLRQQRSKVDERRGLRERSKKLRDEERRHVRAAESTQGKISALFRRFGATDEDEFRQLHRDQETADQLQEQIADATREISVVIGKERDEEDFHETLEGDRRHRLQDDYQDTKDQLQTVETELRRLAEERGSLRAQINALEQDRSLATKQLELSSLNVQLEKAIHDWRVRCATCVVLERIRNHYEEHRQPETLIDASRYFATLTAGKYKRVWTPLGKDILFVDTAEGESLAVDLLSRGTREQLFLSLRLALVAQMAARGVRLPLVLDDVLVNFDATRSARAAELLRLFSQQGHQVLVFTCHEHTWELFRKLKIDARVLGKEQPTPAPQPVLPPRPAQKVRKPSRRPQRPVPARQPKWVPLPVIRVQQPLIVLPIVAPLPKLEVLPEPSVPRIAVEPVEDEFEVEAPPRRRPIDWSRLVAEDSEELPVELPTLPIVELPRLPIVAAEPEKPVVPQVEPTIEITVEHEPIDDEWIRVGPQVRRRDRTIRREHIEEQQDDVSDEEPQFSPFLLNHAPRSNARVA